jgi:hypothetical protein
MAMKAQTKPTVASRSFFIRRWVMVMLRPDARVIGTSRRRPSTRARRGPVAGVTDFGEDDGAGGVAEAGEAGDDLVVGVAGRLGGRVFEAVDVVAGGVEDVE